jgi:hypothetical protein
MPSRTTIDIIYATTRDGTKRLVLRYALLYSVPSVAHPCPKKSKKWEKTIEVEKAYVVVGFFLKTTRQVHDRNVNGRDTKMPCPSTCPLRGWNHLGHRLDSSRGGWNDIATGGTSTPPNPCGTTKSTTAGVSLSWHAP